jgi:transcriptional regulator with XRE-family HTH domain
MGHGSHAPETIGVLLARVRGELGISQLRLAERLCASAGVSTVTRNEISRWEREERIPTGYWLGWLAATLDIPLDQLERAAAAARRRRYALAQVRSRGFAHIPPTWIEQSSGVYVRVGRLAS